MSLKNTTDRWGGISQLLHWTIAILIVLSRERMPGRNHADTVIDVRPMRVTPAKNDRMSPTRTGCLKMNSFTATVAMRPWV